MTEDTHVASLIEYSEPQSAEVAVEWLRQFGLDACERDDRTPVERALALIPASSRSVYPECLAPAAALRALAGSAEDAIRMYCKALEMSPAIRLANGIRTNLALLYSSRGETVEADRTIAAGLDANPEDPRLRGLRGSIRASLRDRKAQRDVDFVESVVNDLPDVWQARIHIWMGMAANYLGDSARCDRSWHRAAQIAEEARCSRLVAIAWHNLEDFFSNEIGDLARAMVYSRLAIDAAERSGDQNLSTLACVSLYALTAEAGDRLEGQSARALLASKRTSGRFNDRFGVIFADALWYGWSKRFDEMSNVLRKLDLGRISGSQSAVIHGLLAVALLGSEDDAKALAAARRAVADGRLSTRESPVELRLRRIGRILGCAVLFHAEQKTEASRALSAFREEERIPLSVRRFADAVQRNSYAELQTTAPDVMGYVLVLEALESVRAIHTTGAIYLTRRERQILQLKAEGSSNAEIGATLGIDEATVKGHNFRIFRKLNVTRGPRAVAEARRLKLISS